MTCQRNHQCQTPEYFNSHPHEEDDIISFVCFPSTSYFNSHPHEEDDGYRPGQCGVAYNFNSHPHEEDDSNFKQK